MEVRFEVGDITKLEVDAVVNPANSECIMGGGVAGAIKKAGGKAIEEEAMESAPVAIGEAIATTAGKLKCDFVIHAPTAIVPAQATNVRNIEKATKAALSCAIDYGFKSIAMPGMGTGIGRVPAEDAAVAMVAAIREFEADGGSLEQIVLTDQANEMVQAWENAWHNEEEADEEE